MVTSLRHFLRRHPRSTVVGVLLVLLGSWLVHLALAYRLSPAEVDKTLSSTLHLDVQTDAVRLTWRGRVTLHHLVIRNGAETLISAPTAEVQIDLRDLARGQINAQAITLDQPELTLSLRQSQDWSERLQANPLPGTIPILINEGLCHYTVTTGRVVRLEHLSGRLILCAGNLTGDTGFTDDLGDRYHVTVNLHSPQVSIKGTIMQSSLAAVASAFHVSSSLGVDGQANVAFSLQGRVPDLSLDASLQVNGGGAAMAPHLQGTLHLTPEASFEGHLDARGGAILGVGPLTSLDLPVHVSASGLRITQARVEVPAGTLQLDADLPAQGDVAMSLTSAAFDPARLSCLQASGLRTSAGPLQVKATGPLSNLVIRLAAVYPTVEARGRLLRNTRLDGAVRLTSGGLETSTLTVGLDGHRVRLTGFVHWSDPHLVQAQVQGMDLAALGMLFNVSSALEPLQGMLSASVSYQPATQRLEVQATVPRGMVAGEPLEALEVSLVNLRQDSATVAARWRQNQREATVHIERTPHGQVAFKVHGAAWRGRAIPDVEGRGSLQGDAATLVARVPGLSPPLDVTVQVQVAAHTFLASIPFNGQDVAAVGRLWSTSVPAFQGKLSGRLTVSGPPMSVQFDGDISALQREDISIDTAHVQIHPGPGLVSDISVEAPHLRWRGQEVGAVTGRMEFQHSTLSLLSIVVPFTQPPLQVTGAVDVVNGRLHLEAPLSGTGVDDLARWIVPHGTNLHGTLTGLATVDGTLDQPVVSFAGHTSGVAGVTGTLSMSARPVSAGSISGTWLLRDATLKGQALPTMRGAVSGTLQQVSVAGHFAVQNLAPVVSEFPGLAGRVTFRATFAPSSPGVATVQVTLDHARRGGRPFPALQASGHLVTPAGLHLSSVSVASLGLSLAGDVNLQQQTFNLTGTLQGTALQDLTSLAGSPSRDTSGVLSGALHVDGSLDTPQIQFTGRVANLVSKSLALGAGQLSLTCTPTTVNGTLRLDHRVGLTSGSLLSHIPGLSAVTNAVVDVRGATISGTPQNPKITPTVQALRGF